MDRPVQTQRNATTHRHGELGAREGVPLVGRDAEAALGHGAEQPRGVPGRRRQRPPLVGHAVVGGRLARHAPLREVAEARAARLAQVLEEDEALPLPELRRDLHPPQVRLREPLRRRGAAELLHRLHGHAQRVVLVQLHQELGRVGEGLRLFGVAWWWLGGGVVRRV